MADKKNITSLWNDEFFAESLLQHLAVATFVIDANHKVIFWNKACEKLTGLKAEEVLGTSNQWKGFYPDDRPCLADLVLDNHFTKSSELYSKTRLMIEIDGFAAENWCTTYDGVKRFLEFEAGAICSDTGEITAVIECLRDRTKQKENEQLITEMAFYDPLTELPNRRLLIERLREEISLTHRQGNTGALLFLDLDDFKTINDSLGHDTGDELLIEVARRLKQVTRETDMAARLGGDEFVVLLGQQDYDMSTAARNVEKVAQTILTAINRPYEIKNHSLYITPSIGITLFPAEDDTPGILLKQADAAMYRAKEGGKNSIHFFHPAIQEAADSRIQIENELRRALKNEEFELYFQPQIDANNQLIGAEALIRWQHPEIGIVLPGEFIPVAEESGLIIDIGNWVIESACQQLANWSSKKIDPPQISINISPRQFRQNDFVSNIDQTLSRYNVDPNKLLIELTEGILLNDIDDAVSKMHAIRSLGVRFSLDDFGTGYSSLAYLQKLPLDHIKIDQTFVRALDQNPNNAAIVETIINMGHNLNLKVIAEGVESKGELNVLKRMNCGEFQGYYFYKPLPITQFEALLQPTTRYARNRALH